MAACSIFIPTTGATTCRECGQPVQCGYDATKVGGVTCGDCLEGRTPLKTELVRAWVEVDRLRKALAAALASFDGQWWECECGSRAREIEDINHRDGCPVATRSEGDGGPT